MKAPVMIEFSGRRALVFGAGETGIRRALKYAEFGAAVTVVSPAITQERRDSLDQAGIRYIENGFEPDYLDHADFCTAATDSQEVNREIRKACADRGILFNSVNADEQADFSFPSTVIRGDLCLSVSTGGTSPALSRQIRRQLEREFGPEYKQKTALLGRLRTLVLASGKTEAAAYLRRAAGMEAEQLEKEIALLEADGIKDTMAKIRIGTRGSKLALTQTGQYADRLREANPGLETEIVVIKTTGDRNQTDALNKIGAKGIFTKELETALLDGDIDVAVHSMKDMPSVLPEGLMLAPPPAREDWHDVLVTAGPLPEKPVIGTGSLRRQVQIRTLYPQASLQDIRGNVDTRIRKMKEGQYDGIIVAAAGLNRLGITEENTGIQITPLVDAFIPAPAQGILAAELRCQDTDTLKLLENAADHMAAIQMKAERRFLVVLEGSCHIPIGAHAQIDGTGIQIDMVGIYGDEAGKAVSGRFSGPADTPEAVGEALARRLKADYQKKYPEGSCE